MGSLYNPVNFQDQIEFIRADFNPPALNTLHTVFDYSGGVKLETLIVMQSNTPTNAEEIDVLITIDGRTILYDGSVINPMVDSSDYSVFILIVTATTLLEQDQIDISLNMKAPYNFNDNAPYRGDPLKGHSIMVQVRQTSAIAAGARIQVVAIVNRSVALT
jgi:hypothetical protein